MIKYRQLELRPRMVAIMVLLYAELERNYLSATDLGKMIGISVKATTRMLREMEEVGIVRIREHGDSDDRTPKWRLTYDGEEWLHEHG